MKTELNSARIQNPSSTLAGSPLHKRSLDCAVRSLLAEIESMLDPPALEVAVGLATLYGAIAWKNPVNVYSAIEIEERIFRKAARRARLSHLERNKNGKLLHVLSEAYSTGGHTRVVERLVGARTQDQGEQQIQDVMVCGECAGDFVRRMDDSKVSLTLIRQTGVDAMEKIAAKMSEYTVVILHINPNDIISSTAARAARESGTKVGLYNHADHCFTYGFGAADMVFEISTFGRAISERFRAPYTWSFAGIPLYESLPADLPVPSGEYVLSSGPSSKYDFTDNGLFANVLPEVLDALNKSCLLVGPAELPPNASKKLIKLRNNGRLSILPPVNHDAYLELLRGCFCYLDSFPLPGGSAFAEAALMGKPCLGLLGPISGYSPLDRIRDLTAECLVDRARSSSFENLCLIRDDLIEAHAPSKVLARIRAGTQRGELFCCPYATSEKQFDLDYMSRSWIEAGKLLLQDVALDWASPVHKARLLLALNRHGLFRLIPVPQVVRLLFGSVLYVVIRKCYRLLNRAT